MFFKMLTFDMRQIEQNNLKKEAAKRPKQMQKYSMMMLFCILLIYVVVLSVEVVGSLGSFSNGKEGTDVYQWLFMIKAPWKSPIRAASKGGFTMRKLFTIPAVLLVVGIITTIFIRRKQNYEKFN